jgi:hypothetical protein
MFLKLLKKRHDKAMEYRVKKHFIIRPIETFLTRSYPGITSEQELMLTTKRYYNFSRVDEFKLMAEFMSIYRDVSGMKDLVNAIVEEHWLMTKKVDQNLHYLWHLYNHGTKAGEYRPFILLAEIQLLKVLDYITEDEAYNMSNMMQSEDIDNLNLVYLSILNMRKKRIEEHGRWGTGPASARLSEIVKDYPHSVLSKELFIATYNKQS